MVVNSCKMAKQPCRKRGLAVVLITQSSSSSRPELCSPCTDYGLSHWHHAHFGWHGVRPCALFPLQSLIKERFVKEYLKRWNDLMTRIPSTVSCCHANDCHHNKALDGGEDHIDIALKLGAFDRNDKKGGLKEAGLDINATFRSVDERGVMTGADDLVKKLSALCTGLKSVRLKHIGSPW